jgi:hypothetical protein
MLKSLSIESWQPSRYTVDIWFSNLFIQEVNLIGETISKTYQVSWTFRWTKTLFSDHQNSVESSPKSRKWHFRDSKFQNFLGPSALAYRLPPPPPIKKSFLRPCTKNQGDQFDSIFNKICNWIQIGRECLMYCYLKYKYATILALSFVSVEKIEAIKLTQVRAKYLISDYI